MTAEQKLLKAFVVNFIKKHDYEVDFTKDDWFKQVCAKPFVGNEDQDLFLACKEYLDQFREVTEKVKPEWVPEVGKLYKGDLGVIEVTKILDYGIECYNLDAHGNYELGFKTEKYKSLIPIAELEGLKEGDKAWCISGSGEAEYYTIESVFSNNLTAHCGKGYLSIYLDGSACMFGGGKQLFWRTSDRAERFGRGDA